jgi:methylenetetrahydrofolate reductase (NADPH)
MDHHYFGIRNILALRGDPPDGQAEWKAREGGYNYAYQLIEQIRNLNRGVYLPRPGGPTVENRTVTDFCIGAAAYPEHPDPEERIRFFRLKAEAGAEFGITDMLFDPEKYARFIDDCAKQGVKIPILPATRILKTQGQAERMSSKFRVSVPKETHDSLLQQDGPDALKRGLDLFMKLVERLKGYGAPGIHVYVIVDTEGAAHALRRLSGK